ncbi:hypothetical protein BH11VER1_BH11VER1_21980 [soil metagenome]
MRHQLSIGIIIGVIFGASICALWYRLEELNKKPTITVSKRIELDSNLEERILSDAKFEDIYTLPWIHDVLLNPKSISIHLRDDNGGIQYDEFRFAAEGKTLNPQQVSALSRSFVSMSSYEIGIGLACMFEPGVIIRFEANGHQIDFLVCFSCEIAAWYADGKIMDNSIAPTVGLSDRSFRIIRRVALEVYQDQLHINYLIQHE